MAFFVLFGHGKDWHSSAQSVVVGVLLVVSLALWIVRSPPVVSWRSLRASRLSPDCPVFGREVLLVPPVPALVPPGIL